MQNLNELAQKIHENAKAKGFWDAPRNTGEVFMLIVSELGEALEAHRKGKRANMKQHASVGHNGTVTDEEWFKISFENCIKDTFEDEIADVVIRILDWCAFAEIPLEYDKDSVNEFELGNIGEALMSVTGSVWGAYVSSEAYRLYPTVDNAQDISHDVHAALDKLFGIANCIGFDLFRHIELKMQYNATRERLHGKKY